MTNEEKAKEIASRLPKSSNDKELYAYVAALEIAAWKEAQMIRKAVEWLKNNIIGMMDGDLPYIQSTYDVSKNEFIEDFKKAMEE